MIKPLIKFSSLAIYIGVGIAAVGRNALAKGKSKYDLTKLEGESKIWTEMVLICTFFFPPRNYSFFGMPVQLASFKQQLHQLYCGKGISWSNDPLLSGMSLAVHREAAPRLPGKSRTGEVLLAECIRKSSESLEVGNHSHQLKAALQIHRGKT